jgi:hypothetical protein
MPSIRCSDFFKANSSTVAKEKHLKTVEKLIFDFRASTKAFVKPSSSDIFHKTYTYSESSFFELQDYVKI